jgi:hypothetical protein
VSRSVEEVRTATLRRPPAAGRIPAAPAVALAAGLAVALAAAPTAPAAAPTAPADTSFSCPDGSVRMSTLMEKTIFQVDVLVLDVCFGPDAAGQIDSLTSDRRYSEALADSVATAALRADRVRARIEFLRDVDLDRFLEGIRENLGKAREAGILRGQDYASIAESLPRWYAFLEDRGIREGDRMLYRIRGDTLRTAYRSAGGERLLDQTDVGPERRLSVLGGYFAPGSDFREGLIRSLLEEEGDG